MAKRINIVNQVFNDWTCLELTENKRPSQKTKLWKTQCKCGNIGYNTTYDLTHSKSTKCKSCSAKEQENKGKYNQTFKYVYFIQSGDYIKIGATNNIPQRIEQLQTGSPHLLKLLYVFNFDEYNELFFHNLFQDYHYRGEWFYMSEVICGSIISRSHTQPREINSDPGGDLLCR